MSSFAWLSASQPQCVVLPCHWPACRMKLFVGSTVHIRSSGQFYFNEHRAEAALDGPASYSVEALLGRRGEPALDLTARRLAEELAAAGCHRCTASRRTEVWGYTIHLTCQRFS